MFFLSVSYYFNPHHPQGGDGKAFNTKHRKLISIHTTRKVVTVLKLPYFQMALISIHTTRKVVTLDGTFYDLLLGDFNPHHPQGGDSDSNFQHSNFEISIHTTRKVVTAITAAQFDEWFISIHTTRKVVTLPPEELPASPIISIHTTRKVVTAILHKNHS